MEMKFDYRNKNVGDKSIIFVEYIINRLNSRKKNSLFLSLFRIYEISKYVYTDKMICRVARLVREDRLLLLFPSTIFRNSIKPLPFLPLR